MTPRVLHLALVGLCLLFSATQAQAQLLSPGRLAQAHVELEGLRNCTSCHALGQRGVSAERCLDCHEELSTRIAEGTGYHATVPEDACADCHQDHLGEDFDLRRLDEADVRPRRHRLRAPIESRLARLSRLPPAGSRGRSSHRRHHDGTRGARPYVSRPPYRLRPVPRDRQSSRRPVRSPWLR